MRAPFLRRRTEQGRGQMRQSVRWLRTKGCEWYTWVGWLWTFYKMSHPWSSISRKICEYSLFLLLSKLCYDMFVHNALMFLLAITMDHPVGIPAGKNKEGNLCLRKR